MSPRKLFVKDLGEFQLIGLLASALGAEHDPTASDDLLLSIGDDAAAWRGSDSATVLTTDTMVTELKDDADAPVDGSIS